jgi:hypothetical protein
MTAPMTTTDTSTPRLFTRAELLKILRIGETTLHWLQRTGKLTPIRIGARVLFAASEINRLAARGATLSQREKEAAAGKRQQPKAKGARNPALRGSLHGRASNRGQ